MDKSLRKLSTSLCGSPGSASGPCISRRVLTAGNLPFPGQRKRPLAPGVPFSHSLPLKKGAKEESVGIRVHPCPIKIFWLRLCRAKFICAYLCPIRPFLFFSSLERAEGEFRKTHTCPSGGGGGSVGRIPPGPAVRSQRERSWAAQPKPGR
jgi:hypothetical protein